MLGLLGVFEQAVMLSIVRPGEGAYGRAILADVEVRLEQKELTTSHLGPGTEVRAGRPRRFYRLAPSGRRALNEARLAVATMWRGFRPQKVLA